MIFRPASPPIAPTFVIATIANAIVFLAATGAGAADVTSTWDTSDGDWSDPSRWDSVDFPNNGNGGLTYDAVVSGGIVTLDQDIEVEGFTLTGARLTGVTPFGLTVNDAFTWNGGRITGEAEVTVASGGTIAIGNAALDTDVTNNGVGTIGTGTMNLQFDGTTFQNNGSLTSLGLTNYTIQGIGGGVKTFNNAGTLIKQGAATTLVIGVDFTNTGAIDAQDGLLQFFVPVSGSGDWNIASGAEVQLRTDGSTLTGVDSFSGDGSLVFLGSTDFSGSQDFGTLDVTINDSLSGDADLTFGGVTVWDGGVMSGNGTTTFAAGGSLSIGNAGVRRTVISNVDAAVSGGNMNFLDGDFTSNGLFTVDDSSSYNFGNSGGVNSFTNAGGFVRRGGGASAFFNGVFFNSTAAVDVEEGSLQLFGGSSISGDTTVDAGAELQLGSGTHTLSGTASISGGGDVDLTGTVDLLGTHTFSGVTVDQDGGGRVSGAGDLTVASGVYRWVEGRMEGSGTTTIDDGATLSLEGGSSFNGRFLSRTLVNDGATTYAGDQQLLFDGGVFQNNATFTIGGSANTGIEDRGGVNAFNNAGTFTKNDVGVFVNNGVPINNTGSFEVLGGRAEIFADTTSSGDFTITASEIVFSTRDTTLTGTASFSGGGTLTIRDNATFDLQGAHSITGLTTSQGEGTAVSGVGDLTIDGGSYTWSAGRMEGSGTTTVNSGTTLELQGNATFGGRTLGRTLINDGTTNYTGDQLLLFEDGVFQSNGAFTISGTTSSGFEGRSGVNAFNNAGTLTKSSAPTTTFFNTVTFNNSGSVDVQAGRLSLGASSGGGDYTVSAGAVLEFGGPTVSTHTLTGAASVTGAGDVEILQTLELQGSHSFSGVSVAHDSGVVTGGGDLTFDGGAYHWSHGRMDGAGTTTIGSGASLEMQGPQEFDGRVLGRTLVNDGTSTHGGALDLLMNDASFVNNGAHTVDSRSYTSVGGVNTFDNAGSFTKQGSGTTTFTAVAFNNSGTVDVQAGTVRADGGGSHSGDFTVASGATLLFSGDHSFTASSNITGAGVFSNSGALTVQDGTLGIAATVAEQSGGDLLSSSWTVANGATLDISSGVDITRSFASVTLDGVGSGFAKIDSLADNQGTLIVTGGNQYTTTAAFSNSGTVAVGPGSTFTANGGFTHQAGATLTGNGQIVGNLQSGGRIAPGNSPGVLNVDGDFTLLETSELEIEVAGLNAATPDYDQVIATGAVTVAGQLDVLIIDNFTPAIGDSIVPIQGASLTGEFDTIAAPNLADAAADVAVEVVYNAADVTLNFVTPDTAIDFERTTAGTTNWADATNWTGGVVPDSTNDITLANLAGSDIQRLDVVESVGLPDSENAFANRLTVEGSATDTITLGVESNISVVNGLTVDENGVVELDGGAVVTRSLTIDDGGLVAGNGTVVGDVVLGSGAGEAMLSPGFSVGSVTVEGNYTQTTGGTLEVEVEGFDPGEADTLSITGEADLGGELMVDATDLSLADVGETVEFLTAGGGVKAGTTFDEVMTGNSTEVYVSPIYGASSVSLQVNLVGDMNGDGAIDPADVGAFALGLSNPLAFFLQYFVSPDSAGGNLDDNGRLDFDDIDEFAALIDGVSSAMVVDAVAAALEAPTVPEPSALTLALGTFVIQLGRSSSRNRTLNASH